MQQWIWQVSVWKDFSFALKTMLGSVTLCALTVTTGTEASKLKGHRGKATLYLNRDSELPVWRMLARHRRCTVFAENTTVIWSGCDSFDVSYVYLLYLFAFGKNNSINILEHPVIWSPSDCNLCGRWTGASLGWWNSETAKYWLEFMGSKPSQYMWWLAPACRHTLSLFDSVSENLLQMTELKLKAIYVCLMDKILWTSFLTGTLTSLEFQYSLTEKHEMSTTCKHHISWWFRGQHDVCHAHFTYFQCKAHVGEDDSIVACG